MADSPLIDRLRSRAESISDTRILQIVLAFIAGGLFVSLVAAALTAIGDAAQRWEWLAPVDAAFRWLDGFAQNFSTEMIGAAITFILLEILLAGRREKEAQEREKQRLILQMGSPFNESAVEAARQLGARGWLEDGSLEGVRLSGANLQGADLNRADLQGAHLLSANLEGANLAEANLQTANLGLANLQEAHLMNANLQEAHLMNANLQEAHLMNANLPGALLLNADLQGANLLSANLQGADLNRADLQGAHLLVVNLQGANLLSANLQGAGLSLANLQGAKTVTVGQLREANGLMRVTLPDGTQLPADDTWRDAFDTWCESVKMDKYGYIVPASLDEDDEHQA